MRVWPHNGVRREAKIAAFAKRHGWRLRYYASLAGQTSNFISLIQTDQFGLSDFVLVHERWDYRPETRNLLVGEDSLSFTAYRGNRGYGRSI